MPANILLPTTPEDAVASFGDGEDVTVFGGGTILVPELAARDTSDLHVLFLARAGLDGVTRTGGTVTIGAGTPIAVLEGLDEPLATAARHVADPEIRAQATVGGNICTRATSEAPRGDLQAPLIALDATVRSASSGSEYVEPIEEFLANDKPRLVLDVSYPDTTRHAGYAAASRPHAHHYTILAVCVARTSDATRVAATGVGARGLRCVAVEQAIAGGSAPAEAAARALDDAGDELRDDALASAWYRRRILPVIVERALAQL
jgi:CO/xanthine dehydrogenase FAD-binding subunit